MTTSLKQVAAHSIGRGRARIATMEPEVGQRPAKKRRRKRVPSKRRRRMMDDSQPLQSNDNQSERERPRYEAQLDLGARRALVLLAMAILQLLAANLELKLQASASTLQDFDGATFYKAPVGSRIRIACNASNWWDDSISLVLWFKGASKGPNTQPIYTIDARQRPLSSGQARHLVADPFKGRARFVLPTGKWPSSNQTTSQQQQLATPYLELAPLLADDQAEYRCRVDYRQRPRENFLIILFVLVPPSSVEIMDATGRPLEQIYGPLNEGAELTLLCLAKGGRPAPLITWRRNGRVIDESYLTLNDFLTLRLASQRKRLGHSPSGSPQASPTLADLSDEAAISASGDKNRNLDNNQGPPSGRRRRSSAKAARHNSSRPLAIGLPQWAASDSINLSATAPTANRKCERDDDDVARGARANPSQSGRPTRAAQAEDQHQLQEQASESGPASSQPADWLAWPEFGFFQLGPDEFFQRQANKLGPAGNGAGATRTRPRADSAAKWRTRLAGAGSNGSPSASVPLIEAQVGETITTAVNLLHLAELSRAHLVQLGGVSPSDRSQDSPQTAKLECHASNLHYDLRSLIKMFAPPSLQPNQSHSTAAGGQLATRPSLVNLEVGPQEQALAESIEAALWANLDSLNYSPGDEHEEGANTTGPLRAAQRQAASDNSADLTLQKSAAELEQRSPDAAQRTSSEDSNWPALIRQQLIRPHQLGSSAAALSRAAASADEPAGASKTGQRAPGQSASELARNKLIALEAYLRPLDVKVTLPQRPLVAGQVSEFSCVSSGSRPAARLSWFKNGLPIGNKTEGNSQQAEVMNVVQNAKTGSLNSTSQSLLSLRLAHEDHQAQLSCRAENEAHLRAARLAGFQVHQQLDSETISLGAEAKQSGAHNGGAIKSNLADSWALEDSITLDVHYTPRVKLELGNRMLREQIHEGQDIFFSCLVDAQPAVYEITWLHNEQPINEGRKRPEEETGRRRAHLSAPSDQAGSAVEAGNAAQASSAQSRMIVSNNSLVLQRVQIDQRGRYACMATNSEGVGLSNPIDLRVLHAPICVQPRASARLGHKTRPQLGVLNELDTSTPPTNRRELHLGERALRPNASSKFKCHMLAEPADSLEFTWYLNNSFNERRVLLASRPDDQTDVELEVTPDADDSADANLIDVGHHAAGKGANSSQTKSSWRPLDRHQVASSQLLFGAHSELDYGRLYCVAKNAIGEQQRACVYTIEQAGPNNHEIAPDIKLACLAVNVTSHSAWIGCDDGSKATPTQASQNNEPARNPARRFKFNVRVLSLGSAESSASARRASEPRNLEARLTSEQLNEPLFALADLRPATSYLLEIEPLDVFDGRPLGGGHSQSLAVVRLTTPAADEPAEMGAPLPTIRQVTEPHRADLLAAALISTRSTSASNSHLHHSQRPASSSGRLLQPRAGSWWDSLASLFQTSPASADQSPLPARSRHPTAPSSNASRAYPIKWLHLEPDATVALLACIGLLLITLIGFIVLRRLWAPSAGARGRRRASSSSGDSNIKRSTDGSVRNANQHDDDDDGDNSDQFDMKMSCLSGGERKFSSKLANGNVEQLASLAGQQVNKSNGSGSMSSSNYSALGAGTWTRQSQQQLELARAYSTLTGRPSRQQNINFLQPSVLNSSRTPGSGQIGSHAEPRRDLADANQRRQQPSGGASRSRSSSCLASEALLEVSRHLQHQQAGQIGQRARAGGDSRASRLIQSSEPPAAPAGATSCSLASKHLRLERALISDADFFLNSNGAAGLSERELQHQMLRERNTLIGEHANNGCRPDSNQGWHLVVGEEQASASPMSSLESPFGAPACSCAENGSAASNHNGPLALLLAGQSTDGQLLSPMVSADEALACWSQLEQGQQVGVVEIVAMMQHDSNKLEHIDQLINQQQQYQPTSLHQAKNNQPSSFNSSSFGAPPHLTIKDSLVSPPLSFTTNTTLSNTTDSYQANNNIILLTTQPTDPECDASTALILNGPHSSEESSNSTRPHRSILRNSGNQKSASGGLRHERNTRSRTPVCECDNSSPN